MTGKQAVVICDLRQGALSCWKMYSCPMRQWADGSIMSSSGLQYWTLFITPSTILHSPRPSEVIHLHITMTSLSCCTTGVTRQAKLCFSVFICLTQTFLWGNNTNLHSSKNIMLLCGSFNQFFLLRHYFSLFSWLSHSIKAYGVHCETAIQLHADSWIQS